MTARRLPKKQSTKPKAKPKAKAKAKAKEPKAKPSTIAIRLQSEWLTNPDLDIRYRLPDLLEERSKGVLESDGYDYGAKGDDDSSPALILFMSTRKPDAALAAVLDFIESDTPVLGNKLKNRCFVGVADAKKADSSAAYRIAYAPRGKKLGGILD